MDCWTFFASRNSPASIDCVWNEGKIQNLLQNKQRVLGLDAHLELTSCFASTCLLEKQWTGKSEDKRETRIFSLVSSFLKGISKVMRFILIRNFVDNQRGHRRQELSVLPWWLDCGCTFVRVQLQFALDKFCTSGERSAVPHSFSFWSVILMEDAVLLDVLWCATDFFGFGFTEHCLSRDLSAPNQIKLAALLK